jgi:hypothetical protein
VSTIFGTKEAQDSGIGYEEMPYSDKRFCHLEEKYNIDSTSKDPDKLKVYIKEKLYLSIDKLDYNYILEEFIP